RGGLEPRAPRMDGGAGPWPARRPAPRARGRACGTDAVAGGPRSTRAGVRAPARDHRGEWALRLGGAARGRGGPGAVAGADLGQRIAVGDEVFSAPMDVFDNGQAEAYPALRRVGEALAPLGGRLVGCASCAWFRFSGMSRDMSGASTGYCGLVGFRNA